MSSACTNHNKKFLWVPKCYPPAPRRFLKTTFDPHR